MRIYISGPMAGRDREEYIKEFHAVEEKIKARGHEAVNPCELENLPLERSEYLQIDMFLVELSDAIWMLPGWEKSQGACMERGYAVKLRKIIIYEGKEDERL